MPSSNPAFLGRSEYSLEDYLNDPAAVRRKILDAAARLFRTKGFSFVKMADIAGAVGLSKAGLYHHCPSKDELLADIVRLCGELLSAQLTRARLADASALDRLKLFVVSRMETIAKYQDMFSIVWQERPFISSESFGGIARETEQYRAGVRDLILQAQKAGEIRANVDPHLLMLAIDGMTGWAYIWYREGGAEDPASIGAAFWDFVAAGVTTPKSARSKQAR
jgi:AcrR family transcriptional regulator